MSARSPDEGHLGIWVIELAASLVGLAILALGAGGATLADSWGWVLVAVVASLATASFVRALLGMESRRSSWHDQPVRSWLAVAVAVALAIVLAPTIDQMPVVQMWLAGFVAAGVIGLGVRLIVALR